MIDNEVIQSIVKICLNHFGVFQTNSNHKKQSKIGNIVLQLGKKTSTYTSYSICLRGGAIIRNKMVMENIRSLVLMSRLNDLNQR